MTTTGCCVSGAGFGGVAVAELVVVGVALGSFAAVADGREVVADRRQVFTWGGGCALHDKGTRRKKLPDLAPDPFREREELVQRLIAGLSSRRAGETAARRRTSAT